MPNVAKVDFSKGVNVVGDRRMLPDGYLLVADNVDLRSGFPRAFRFPEYFKEVPPGTTRIWEYRGKWYASDLWRDYAAEMVDGRERIYWTEWGAGHTYPQKQIDGTVARLGTPPPGVKLEVLATGGATTGSSGASGTFTMTITQVTYSPGDTLPSEPGIWSFIGVAEDSASLEIARSGTVSLTYPPQPYYDSTLWKVLQYDITGVSGASQYKIYAKPPSGSKYGRIVGPTSTTSAKIGNYELSDTDGLDAASFKGSYIYTFVRNVNGHWDESGPSPVSDEIDKHGVITVKRHDGGFSYFQPQASGVGTFTNPTPAISSVPSANGTTLQIESLNPSGGRTNIVTTVADGLASNDVVTLTALNPCDSTLTVFSYVVTVPTALTALAASDIKVTYHDLPTTPVITSGTHTIGIAKVRGHSIATAGVDHTYATAHSFGPKTDKDIDVPSGNDAKLEIPWDTKCDSYVVFLDGGYNTTLTSSQVVGGIISIFISDNTTPAAVSYTADYSATHQFSISASLAPLAQRDGQTLPGVIADATTVITVAGGHNQTLPSSVRLSAFETTDLNGMWGATIINGTEFSVPVFTSVSNSSSTIAYKVEFNTLNSNGVDEKDFYDHWNLYRTGDTGEFLLVDEIPIDVMEYEDAVKTEDLGETPESYYTENGLYVVFQEPPQDLHGLVLHNQMLFGIEGNSVRWTPINKPDAWPGVFRKVLSEEPLALATRGSFLIAFTGRGIQIINGMSPSDLSLMDTQIKDGIVAPRSVQATTDGVLYLARRGVMMFDGVNATCLTEDRIPGHFFTAPSQFTTDSTFWWYPTEMTYNYAALMGEQKAELGSAGEASGNPVSAIIGTRTIDGPNYNIRSFYYMGKYFLFWSDYT